MVSVIILAIVIMANALIAISLSDALYRSNTAGDVVFVWLDTFYYDDWEAACSVCASPLTN